MTLAERVTRAWYTGSPWLHPLRPLGALVGRVARKRREQLQKAAQSVPVLVVGNITVGGTGKTPLVIALCKAAAAHGLKVVVISRGYGARPPSFPWQVQTEHSPVHAGDEPLLIHTAAGVPVIIDPQRARALTAALALTPDLVISDDGLQHYALPRTAEIAVVDGERGLGNGRCLPAGPLREPADRLGQVDWVVVNGHGGFRYPGAFTMTLETEGVRNAATGETLSLADFAARQTHVHAIAGIGHPARFFDTLLRAGLSVTAHPFPDHHVYSDADLALPGDAPVVMTEKDLVKCQAFISSRIWVLPVTASLPESFFEALWARLLPGRVPSTQDADT